MLLLSCLLLSRGSSVEGIPRAGLPALLLANISRQGFDELVSLASSNHVLVRGMERLISIQMREAGDTDRASWAANAMETELRPHPECSSVPVSHLPGVRGGRARCHRD